MHVALQTGRIRDKLQKDYLARNWMDYDDVLLMGKAPKHGFDVMC